MSARRDHLAHVQTSAVLLAEAPERDVRDARDRSEHHWRVDGTGFDPQGLGCLELRGHRHALSPGTEVNVRMRNGHEQTSAGATLLVETVRKTSLDRALSTALGRWRAPTAIYYPGKIDRV